MVTIFCCDVTSKKMEFNVMFTLPRSEKLSMVWGGKPNLRGYVVVNGNGGRDGMLPRKEKGSPTPVVPKIPPSPCGREVCMFD